MATTSQLHCAAIGCDSTATATGYCAHHSAAIRREYSPDNSVNLPKTKKCKACDAPAVAKGYCNKHYHKAVRYGDTGNHRQAEQITYGTETLSIADWARRVGLSYSTLQYRVRSHWPIEDALTIPAGQSSRAHASRKAAQAAPAIDAPASQVRLNAPYRRAGVTLEAGISGTVLATFPDREFALIEFADANMVEAVPLSFFNRIVK